MQGRQRRSVSRGPLIKSLSLARSPPPFPPALPPSRPLSLSLSLSLSLALASGNACDSPCQVSSCTADALLIARMGNTIPKHAWAPFFSDTHTLTLSLFSPPPLPPPPSLPLHCFSHSSLPPERVQSLSFLPTTPPSPSIFRTSSKPAPLSGANGLAWKPLSWARAPSVL